MKLNFMIDMQIKDIMDNLVRSKLIHVHCAHEEL